MNKKKEEKKKSTFREYAEALLIALLLAFIIRSFVVQAFKIPSESMLPTLKVGDHLLVNKFTYGPRIPFTQVKIMDLSDPQFEDIVVFEYPGDESKDYIKRIIGTPGDKIRIDEQERLHRNGNLVEEDYVHKSGRQPTGEYPMEEWPPERRDHRVRDNLGPIEIPEGKYFVMGDNRGHSYDSRYWGVVREEAILGKAWRIYWSWGDWTDVRWSRIGTLVE